MYSRCQCFDILLSAFATLRVVAISPKKKKQEFADLPPSSAVRSAFIKWDRIRKQSLILLSEKMGYVLC